MSGADPMQEEFPGAYEGRAINKLGVPYHSYTLRLANGAEVGMDVGYEEDWGNVQQCVPTDCDDWIGSVGWGNDEDGHLKIIGVADDETGESLMVYEWAKCCVWPYADNYTSP